MPDRTIKKAIKNYKSKRRVKKLLKSGNPEEKYDAQGNIIFKNGGKTKKVKKNVGYSKGGFIQYD